MLKLVTDRCTFKVYAIRTDGFKLPVIEEVYLYECCDRWGSNVFRTTKQVKSKNELYPYDALYSRQYIKSNSISDCYSKGYIFYSKSFAIKRLEMLMGKHVCKMDKAIEIVADWKARIDFLKIEK